MLLGNSTRIPSQNGLMDMEITINVVAKDLNNTVDLLMRESGIFQWTKLNLSLLFVIC